ncbi:MAG: LAGLIDADG family homing endonuclease, partial [Salinirussus sp.]
LNAVIDAFEERLEWLHEQRTRVADGDCGVIETLQRELGISQESLASGSKVPQTSNCDLERAEAVPDGGTVADAKTVLLDRIDETLGVEASVARLRDLVESDVRWDRIESIKTVQPDDDWVYDLEVAGTHNYVSEGVVSHNSQLLQYIRHIAPRSVYTSGKGASTAGLTAAAVRDDFGDGQQWTLEAGALVLADKGIAAVDELDKMRCVTGDTLVSLGDGRIERIRDLAKSASESGDVEYLSNGRTIRNPGFDAWTMTKSGQLERRPVTAVHEYEAPGSLKRVRLQSGETLRTTAEHPFFVLEGGDRIERPAKELDVGDWIYVPQRLQPPAVDGGVLDDRQRVSDVGRSNGELSASMGAILGYLSGDGAVYADREDGVYELRFKSAEEDLLADFEAACRTAFGVTPTRSPSEDDEDRVEGVRLEGKDHLHKVLDAGMNLTNVGDKSFPSGVTHGTLAVKAAFVRALADSKGCVDGTGGRLQISSTSETLLHGVKQLLLEFDISCQLKENKRDGTEIVYELAIIEDGSLNAFNTHIGFTLSRKQSALERVCEDAAGAQTTHDVIPEVAEVLSECRFSLRLEHSECGVNADTYRDFENGDLDVPFQVAYRITERFIQRTKEAETDLEELQTEQSWAQLDGMADRYHVSQQELAEGLELSQQAVSRRWGRSKALRARVRQALREIVRSVATTDLGTLRQLVEGDVKWRRVEEVSECQPERQDGREGVHRLRLAELLDCAPGAEVERARTLLESEVCASSWSDLRAEMERHDVSFADIGAELEVTAATVSRWFGRGIERDRFPAVRQAAMNEIRAKRAKIRKQLESIEKESTCRVYDLSVAGTKNYVANGMIVHNSEDRSSLHEALEQQSVSISKAGINATLKARCSLLGAANPKYGRFDQYEPIAEQIDLEPALVSRFDLIFTVTDEPDAERDANLADHIIKTNYAGELHTHREKIQAANHGAEEVAAATDEVAPTIEPELLRKYIAYAKRTCFPTMTEAAKAEIRDFYVDLRARGADEDAPVPVTARKLEALVRLAEASARVRLSDTVEVEDAERATDIVLACLREIGMDPETGQFDADVIETGTSKSQRDRIKNLKALVSEIEDEYDEGAPIEVVLERAEEAGMDVGTAEHEIEQLKQKGEIYEPRTDYLRTT